jgi:hypothetical protein
MPSLCQVNFIGKNQKIIIFFRKREYTRLGLKLIEPRVLCIFNRLHTAIAIFAHYSVFCGGEYSNNNGPSCFLLLCALELSAKDILYHHSGPLLS